MFGFYTQVCVLFLQFFSTKKNNYSAVYLAVTFATTTLPLTFSISFFVDKLEKLINIYIFLITLFLYIFFIFHSSVLSCFVCTLPSPYFTVQTPTINEFHLHIDLKKGSIIAWF